MSERVELLDGRVTLYRGDCRQRYFDIACRRIEDAAKQPDMFIEPPPKPLQGGLGL